MSHIAQALAKAKERTGTTTAPFLSGGSVPAALAPDVERIEAARRQARNRQRFWILVVVISLPLLGFIYWSQLRSPAAELPLPPSASAHATADVSAPHSPLPSAPVAASGAKLGSASGALAAAPAPRPELMQTVAGLAISAVMPGEPPRIMLAGRVVRAGETAEGELTFAGVADGALRFTDARGAVYTRRY